MIHVQDVKDGTDSGNGGGFLSTTVESSPDLTVVVYNDITGASLYVSGSTSSTTGEFPLPSATGSMLNNPDASTHNHLCYVTLPAGTYYVEWQLTSSPAGLMKVGIYNLTDSSWIIYPVTTGQAKAPNTGKFTIASQSNIELRSPSHYTTVTNIDFGSANHFTSTETKAANSDFKIYKLS